MTKYCTNMVYGKNILDMFLQLTYQCKIESDQCMQTHLCLITGENGFPLAEGVNSPKFSLDYAQQPA